MPIIVPIVAILLETRSMTGLLNWKSWLKLSDLTLFKLLNLELQKKNNIFAHITLKR
jgi:hypothetical protein